MWFQKNSTQHVISMVTKPVSEKKELNGSAIPKNAYIMDLFYKILKSYLGALAPHVNKSRTLNDFIHQDYSPYWRDKRRFM